MANNQERHDKHMYHGFPSRVAEFLGKDVSTNIKEYQKTPIAREISSIVENVLKETITPFYQSKGVILSTDNLTKFIKGPLETVNFRSNIELPVLFGIYMSEFALVASYNDLGGYFKNQNLKRSYENREIYREKNKIVETGTGNSNAQFIYDYADKIYVDISEGTLYVGISKSKVTSSHWDKFKPEDTKKEKNDSKEIEPIKGKNSAHQRNARHQKVRQ